MFNWIAGILSGIKKWILKEFRDYLKSVSAQDVADILPIARKAVKIAFKDNPKEGEGGERFQAAFDYIVEHLKKEGIDIQECIINQAIEIAWGIVKPEVKDEQK